MKRAWWGLAFWAAASCSKPAQDVNDAKLMPRPPPPPLSSAKIATQLAIPVEIEGEEEGETDRAGARSIVVSELAGTKADFEQGEHRAWRLAPLIGPAAEREGAVITVIGENDIRITMPRPKSAGDAQPVLMLSRRGQVTLAMVLPSDPFPAYHGRGRRLARGGDPLPRLSGSVVKIVVTQEAR